ncbi:hypothetical protein OIU76_014461 [Salix suchowensis]|uniref:Uncharacterized protein n=1 Tax=Salix suchowensis TaxID=1278906 RepID=A0ABQ9A1H2_9ROSI|nr:hypothetical protein OIU76_014461 [Salix suchowensis]KAJ6321191.1 hypothetical protein OIU77_011318 [Salix suchowensis]KAJ6351813.1 hypothetical protein OIU78_007660 [Salix suchowensis]
MAMELEDDLFFADLSKQISLLIMDDEDPVTTFPPVSFQAFSRGNYPSAPSHFIHEQNCRRESCKGTGVFIPKSSHPRRKHRQGRYGQKSNDRQHRNTRVVSQASDSNLILFPTRDSSKDMIDYGLFAEDAHGKENHSSNHSDTPYLLLDPS